MKNIASLGIPRIVGYSLLLMSIINWADIVLPPQLLNPTWELQTVGAIVESVPLLLFALVLIFYGEGTHRNKIERLFVRTLSQACLPIALAFGFLVLVAATSTVRINQQIDVQVGNVFSQQMEQLNQLESQIDEASSRDIDDILESQGIALETAPSGTR
ncbi:MAG: HpsJ family protein, partial [Cyanobacteria bacterium J06555_13]